MLSKAVETVGIDEDDGVADATTPSIESIFAYVSFSFLSLLGIMAPMATFKVKSYDCLDGAYYVWG